MAVVIRLQRVGKPKHPHFRVVAVEKKRGPRGAALEVLGSYDPRADKVKDKLHLKEERLKYWLGVGAQPSETVGSLLKSAKVSVDKK
ncbi:MAG: 30S ribosomal protein S16 [Elusimicrobia bacterium]|nr:30S ribosomal protein S16 [Elusimicrobiota bacterium]